MKLKRNCVKRSVLWVRKNHLPSNRKSTRTSVQKSSPCDILPFYTPASRARSRFSCTTSVFIYFNLVSAAVLNTIVNWAFSANRKRRRSSLFCCCVPPPQKQGPTVNSKPVLIQTFSLFVLVEVVLICCVVKNKQPICFEYIQTLYLCSRWCLFKFQNSNSKVLH